MATQRLKGKVIGNKMDKTIIVEVKRRAAHPKYKKILSLKKKYYVHAEEPREVGEEVEIELTRPISKLKRWRVITKPTKKAKK